MKAIAYSIKPFEKESLAIANHKKHEITLISNALGIETAAFAGGKDAAIVMQDDNVSAPVIEILAGLGVKYIVTRSLDTSHIDKNAAARFGIKLSNIPLLSTQQAEPNIDDLQHIANQTIRNLDLWQLNKCVGKACICAEGCKTVAMHEEAK
ncbi:D-isomer specific 2-hydroxyacid dehydrogenase-like protein [Mucilaginibacter oryzae]|uniref:D-isomer specific 2-hydroxyacid dehydrogenase-like protein n=1 Tax=Mucilaginibacter oryzae TaxID=468058 RepID=A0A316HFU0_9SPHI|nr:lactate dehydrogenase [Mucilaginibacter oryzae]PWK80089.1 D-isomer specific 2-hydroxyacid dehydrogenase-like protein [Mucilaginibacter oryzae]